MISEKTIIALQFLAAILMGYDYLVSIRFKESLDLKSQSLMAKLNTNCREILDSQKEIILSHKSYFLASIIFAVVAVLIYIFLKLIVTLEFDKLVLFLFIVFLLFCGYCTTIGCARIVGAVFPIIIPTFIKYLVIFLQRSSKGVIPAIGILFLFASFILRYLNAK
jgi:hypothetical protein